MRKNQLLNLLRGKRNLSLSGDTDLKVLSDIHVKDSENKIFIIGTGLNEYEEEISDSFIIDLNSIDYISDSFFDNIELHTRNGKLILIEGF
jgi:hypothetical protein